MIRLAEFVKVAAMRVRLSNNGIEKGEIILKYNESVCKPMSVLEALCDDGSCQFTASVVLL